MTRFTTRIELHDGNSKDYDNLHAQMALQGFSRKVTSDAGVTYWLPWAEYNFDGTASLEDVFDRAKVATAAAAPRLKREVLVTESKARKWDGLEKA
jgi:hypothetical protein